MRPMLRASRTVSCFIPQRSGAKHISYELGKLLAMFLYPLNQALLLGLFALLALLFGSSRMAFCLLFVALCWLYVCSTPVMADFLMGRLERDYPPTTVADTETAEAIVLLGGAIRGDVYEGLPGDLSQQADRLVHTVALYKAGRAPFVVVSGGGDERHRTEAEIMSELLQIMGIPEEAIVLEEESRNTYQNAVFTASLLDTLGVRKILLVTSAFHMRRAETLFKRQGLDVIPAPTDFQHLSGEPIFSRWLPSVGDLWQSTHALHEHFGYLVYRYRGWL